MQQLCNDSMERHVKCPETRRDATAIEAFEFRHPMKWMNVSIGNEVGNLEGPSSPFVPSSPPPSLLDAPSTKTTAMNVHKKHYK